MSRCSESGEGPPRAVIRAGVILLLTLLAPGCHVYHPVESGSPSPGSDVRVRLTAPGAIEISGATDEATRVYEGRLLDAERDTLRLSVVQARYGRDFERARTFRSELAIPRNFVEGVEVREISVWRTALVSAAAAGVVGVLLHRAGGGGGGVDPPENGNGTTTSRIPPGGIEIFRLPVGGGEP